MNSLRSFCARVSLIKSLAISMLFFSAYSTAVPIVGVNDPVNNTAEFTWLGSSITIENTSNFDARITAFGFDTSSTVLGLDSVSGTLDDSAWSMLFSPTVGGGGGGSFEFGVSTGTNLTGGFPNAGISVGNTGTFSFDLGLTAPFTDISNIFVRFQRTGADGERSDRGEACLEPNSCEPPQVSEPGTIGLMALGALGLLVGRRKAA